MTYGKSLLILVVLSCVSVSAQQISGSMRGTVTDPTGAVVQGATVTAQETDTAFTRATTTDHGGNYVLLELPVGRYRVEVTAKNFQRYVQDGISLNVNETAVVSARLVLGSERGRRCSR